MVDINTLIFGGLGAVNIALAGALTYYSIQSSHTMRGAYAQYMITIGNVLFVLVSIHLLIQYFFYENILTFRPAPFTIFSAGIVLVFSGMVYSGIVVRAAAGKIPWLELLRKLRYGIWRLAGIAVVSFIVLPIWFLSSQYAIQTTIFTLIAQLSFMACFGFFILSERKLYHSTLPTVIAAGEAEEEVLRDDIRLFRAYADLTNRFAVAVSLVTGVEFIREALKQSSETHGVLRGCEIGDTGFMKSDCGVENVIKIGEKKSLPKICAAFADLNTRLIKLYGAVTSPRVAKNTFENIYKTVKEGYGTLTNFPEIAKGVPSGILEEEKLAYARKEELANLVREKTAELEKTVSDLESARYGMKISEKRFKGVVSLLPETVFETDNNFSITFMNIAGFEKFGYTPRDLEGGLNLLQLVSAEDREKARKLVEFVLREKVADGGDYSARDKSGKTFPAMMRASPIVYADKPVGLRGVFIDITDQKRIEEVEHEGVIDVLTKIQRARRVEKAEPESERIRKIQAESIDVIKRHLAARKPSPIVEEYKAFLTRPAKKKRARKKPKAKR